MANRKIDLFNERFNADKKGVRSRVCVASLLHGPYDPQTREDALTLLYRVLTPEYNRCFNRKTFTFKAANVFYITNEQLSLRNQSHAGWWYVIMSGASSALTSRNWGQFFNAAGILNIAPKFRNPATSDNFKYYSTLFLMPDTKGIVLESLISYMKSWMCIDEKILNDLPGNTLKWFLGACSDRGLCGQEDAATSVVGEVITATRSIISVASLSKRTAPSVGVGSGADAQRISRRRVTQSADANHSQILVARVSNDGIFDGSRDISFTANMIQEGLIEPGGRTILPSLSRATGCSISSGSSQAFVAVGQKLLEFDDGRPAGFSFMPSDSMASQSQKGALQLPALTMCPGPFTPSDQGLARYPHHDCLFTPSNDDDGMFPQRSFTPSFMDSQSYQTHCLEDGCMSYLAGINNPPTPEPLAAALHRRFSDTVTGNGYANVLSQLPQLQYLEGAVNLFQAFFSLIQKKHGIVFPNPVALMGTAEFDRLRTAGYDSQQCLEFQTLVRQIPSVFSSPLPLLYPDHFTVLASLNVVYEHITSTQANAGASRVSAFQDIARLTAVSLTNIATWIDTLATLSDVLLNTSMDTYADPSYTNLRRAVVVVRPLRNIPDILVPLASSAPMKPEDIIRRIAVQSREVSSAISSHQISARIEQYIQTLQTMGSLMPGALFDTPATTRFLPYTQFSFMAEGDHDARSCANFIAAMAPTPF